MLEVSKLVAFSILMSGVTLVHSQFSTSSSYHFTLEYVRIHDCCFLSSPNVRGLTSEHEPFP